MSAPCNSRPTAALVAPAAPVVPTLLPQNTRTKDPMVDVGWEQSPFDGLIYSRGEDTT